MNVNVNSKNRSNINFDCEISGNKCPVFKVIYVLGGIVIALYCAFLFDNSLFRSYSRQYTIMQPFEYFFDNLEHFSPFHQEIFVNDLPSKQVIMTPEELLRYNGKDGSPGLYISLIGHVFDVSKSPKYYGPGGSYEFFAGLDASRAFVTGNFDEAGLIEDVTGLNSQDYLALEEWLNFYRTEYREVGLVSGYYYEPHTGKATKAKLNFDKEVKMARYDNEKNSAEKEVFPVCNSEWSPSKGTRVWCTSKTGGKERGWVGVPRRLFYPNRKERCACVRDTGPSSSEKDVGTGNIGDLGSPHIKLYEGCDVKSYSCIIAKPDT